MTGYDPGGPDASIRNWAVPRRGSPGMVLIIFVIRWFAMLAVFVWSLQYRCG